MRRIRGLRRVRPVLLALVIVTTVVGCSSQTDVRTQPVREATVVPTNRATVPNGWIVHRGPGFRVALPPGWADRPKDQRAAPSAAIEVGIPFTGQSVSPPVFMGFVERGEVGPLTLREKVLRLQITSSLPKATLGSTEHVQVAGANDAETFDVVYPESGGTSVLGTALKPTTFRQRELIVETPGLPKFGFRYAASQDQFDLAVWRQILASLVVSPSDAPSVTQS